MAGSGVRIYQCSTCGELVLSADGLLSEGRRKLKRIAAGGWRTLAGFGVGRLSTVCPILCYHSVNDTYDDHADPLPIRLFAEHVAHLADRYNVVRLADVVAALDGRRALVPRAVVITFDDGYVDNFYNAYPVLRRHAVPATFFVVSGFVDGKVDLIGKAEWRAMSWAQVAEIARDDLMSIGAHGVTHRKLSKLAPGEVVREMDDSRTRIEQQIGSRPRFFAYPDGQGRDISAAAKDLAMSLGFDAAVSTFWRTTHSPSDRFILGRVMISSRDSVADLEAKLSGAYDFLYYVHKTKALLRVLSGRGGIWR